MRHTLKWSFFIGTAIAGAMLALLKLFQPVRYEHLVIFGYGFVASSVAAGYVAHKNFVKRNLNGKNMQTAGMDEKSGSAAGAEGNVANNFSGAVRKIPIGAGEELPEMGKNASEYFVPASQLAKNSGNMQKAGNDIPKAAAPENETTGQCRDAESFLNEIESEESERGEPEDDIAENGSQSKNSGMKNSFSRYCGKPAKIFTKDGKIFSGKLAQVNSHIVLEDACCASERKSLLMVSRDDVARLEVE